MERKLTVTLVGAGALARTLAALLPQTGFRVVEIVVRDSGPSARRAAPMARALGAELNRMPHARFAGDVVWFAVNDSAIAECAEQAAKDITLVRPKTANVGHQPLDWKTKIALHSSGASTSDLLGPLRRRGAAVASLHPMMTFVRGRVSDLHDAMFAVEGDARAVRVAKRIATALGGRTFAISKSAKTLYHAFGAFLSPLLVAQLDRAAELAVAAGVPRRDLARVMRPILSATVANFLVALEQGNPGAALSGPLVRGDVETIRKHVAALKKHRHAHSLYLALTRAAVESRGMPVKKREEIGRVVGQVRGGER